MASDFGKIVTPAEIGFNEAVNAIVTDKASGAGMQVDLASPTYGWHDIIGDLKIRAIGANDPVFSVFRNGIRAYEFSAILMNEM